ncbi:hypothetical protein LY78DRAFT_697779 [Colletotrichum sublineola]|nr:hypothetical protein LY78DRAFT_697779 [Colletotrichum sublineola]
MRITTPQAKRQCVHVSEDTTTDTKSPLTIENFHDGETVHQRCVIIKGYYTTTIPWHDFITISSSDGTTKTFPPQTWPLDASRFKVLVLLAPGKNILKITCRSTDAENPGPLTLTLNYIPLLQTPPLYLAIMVAKDSPLLIDCPPSKYGPLSTAHSSIDAAVAKMRMTAYMWQAFTAEDMRMKGLGRRSFRLEEEFAVDTTTSQVFTSSLDDSAAIMRSTAKVHIVRSSKTVAELRDADVAQQNEAGRNRDKLFDYFLDALASHGGPFEASSRPVVAGMLLDAHFSTGQGMILGHAALGCHNPKGVSLGIMGSHLTYSFPRFLDRDELEGRFDPEEELNVYVLRMNGKTKTVRNLWKVFASSKFVRIPGSDVVLRKRSVMSKELEESDESNDEFWSWATLLTKKDADGKVLGASSIDVRTGCILDGAYVEFPDGTKVNCGPRISKWGGGKTKHEFGGHAAENVRVPKGGEIVRIEVARGNNILHGMRIHFGNGKAGGALSGYEDEPQEETLALEVQSDERIVGFYGRSWWGHHFDGLVEFGIITAPNGVELPDQIYKVKELQNTDGGQSAEDLRGDRNEDDGGDRGETQTDEDID